jgi:hypothetical protein
MNKDVWLLQPLTHPDQVLMWMQLIFLWMSVNYLLSNDPAGIKANKNQSAVEVTRWKLKVFGRSLVTAIVTFLLLGICTDLFWRRFLISTIVSVLSFLLPYVRFRLAVSESDKVNKLTAEWETLSNFTFIIVVAMLISICNLHIRSEHVLFQVAAPSNHLTVILAVASGLIFVMRGGTQLVRSILDKFEALPMLTSGNGDVPDAQAAQVSGTDSGDNKSLDVKEYNRGRMIGNLERILLLIVVLVGTYEALAFLVAGKGLIRAKEFEDRDFAEYFLLGTFASTGLALVIGLILSMMIKLMW